MLVGSNGDGGDEDEDDARSCFDEDEDDTQGALLLRPARRHTLIRAGVSSVALLVDELCHKAARVCRPAIPAPERKKGDSHSRRRL